VAAKVVPFPKPGTDEIQKACEETWVGHEGYVNAQGEKIPRALAYLGDVVTAEGKVITEVFVTDIPEDWDKNLEDQNLGGTETSFPEMPKSFTQQRITHTAEWKFPGVQGPRHWLKSSKNGDRIFFYAKSEDGIVQLFSVSPTGGEPIQITRNEFSPHTAFSLSPDDQWIVFGYQNQLYLTEISTGKTQQVGPAPQKDHSELCNINWSYSGKILTYNKKVSSESGSWFQVFLVEVF
jgi:WD40 repeat protein